jgi:hypothetical protein
VGTPRHLPPNQLTPVYPVYSHGAAHDRIDKTQQPASHDRNFVTATVGSLHSRVVDQPKRRCSENLSDLSAHSDVQLIMNLDDEKTPILLSDNLNEQAVEVHLTN